MNVGDERKKISKTKQNKTKQNKTEAKENNDKIEIRQI